MASLGIDDRFIRLALACADPYPSAQRLQEIRDLAGLINNWQGCVLFARSHRFLPLMYCNLVKSGSDAIPADVLGTMKNAYLACCARQIVLTGRMMELYDFFQNAHLRTVPWKGPVLALTCYSDPGMRHFDDLDFLVHPEDMEKAVDLITGKGYISHVALPSNVLKPYLAAGNPFIASYPVDATWIDISTSPVPSVVPLNPNPAWLPDSTTVADIQGSSIRVLKPEHQFLLLCVHGANHRWRRLIWIADLRAMIKTFSLDHSRLMAMAEQTGLKTILLTGFHLACGTIPEDLQAKAHISPDDIARSARFADEILKSFDKEVTEKLFSRFELRARDRTTDKCRYLFAQIFRPSYSDWTTFLLPCWLSFIHWFLRPVRLIVKFVLIKQPRRNK